MQACRVRGKGMFPVCSGLRRMIGKRRSREERGAEIGGEGVGEGEEIIRAIP